MSKFGWSVMSWTVGHPTLSWSDRSTVGRMCDLDRIRRVFPRFCIGVIDPCSTKPCMDYMVRSSSSWHLLVVGARSVMLMLSGIGACASNSDVVAGNVVVIPS
jgi:hypothetical protein